MYSNPTSIVKMFFRFLNCFSYRRGGEICRIANSPTGAKRGNNLDNRFSRCAPQPQHDRIVISRNKITLLNSCLDSTKKIRQDGECTAKTDRIVETDQPASIRRSGNDLRDQSPIAFTTDIATLTALSSREFSRGRFDRPEDFAMRVRCPQCL